MKSLGLAWFVLLSAAFIVSILALICIQVRGLARYGWRGFHRRSFLQTYWRELSPLGKSLAWSGLIAFAITWLAAMTWKIATALGQ